MKDRRIYLYRHIISVLKSYPLSENRCTHKKFYCMDKVRIMIKRLTQIAPPEPVAPKEKRNQNE